MYDIYTMNLEYEACPSDKGKIDLVFPYTVLHFVLTGAGYVNGKRVCAPAVFVCLEENRMCYYPDESDPWSYVYFRVRGRGVREAFLDCGFPLEPAVLPFDRTDALYDLLALYHHLDGCPTPDTSTVIANAIFLLFQKKERALPEGGRTRRRAEEIRRYIDENYYRAITIDAIATHLYLNKNYLRTVFVRHYGLSPKQYLQRTRMQRAAFLLQSTEESVTLIATSVGYEDTLLFSRMFKKYFGASPRDYRNQTYRNQENFEKFESICE